MPDDPTTVQSLIARIDGQWPLVGDSSERASVVERLTAMFEALPEAVCAPLFEAMGDPTRAAWAQTVIYGLEIASSQGVQAVEWIDGDRIRVIDPEGRVFAMGFLGTTLVPRPMGDPGAIKQLLSALDQAFADRRYVVWFRRRVPAEPDVGAIGRAVTLWLAAISRGEWQGYHAIYEDDSVELELLLTPDRGRQGGTACILKVGPVTSLERLARIDSAVMDRVAEHDAASGELPLVYVLGASAQWNVPRGFPEQLLYGTADWVRTEIDGENRSYQAAFQSSGHSLFSDPLARNLAALWWVEPSGDDPLAYRCWSHENPWTEATFVPEPLSGPRFHLVNRVRGANGTDRLVLTWSERFRGGSR